MKIISRSFYLLLLFCLLTGCASGGNPAGISLTESSTESPTAVSRLFLPPPGGSPASISLVSRTSVSADTRFNWMISGGSSPALKSWLLPVPEGYGENLIRSCSESWVWVENDPASGLRGIRFTRSYYNSESRQVTLILAGNWSDTWANAALDNGTPTLKRILVPRPLFQPQTRHKVQLHLYFDLNGDGVLSPGEPGLSAVNILLGGQAGQTDNNGQLVHEMDDGNWPLTITCPTGLIIDQAPDEITVAGTDCEIDVAARLNLTWYETAVVNSGHGQGWWKQAVNPSPKKRPNGGAIAGILDQLSGFALPILNPATPAEAAALLSGSGSRETAYLRALLTAELNFADGSQFEQNSQATAWLLWQAEWAAENNQFLTAMQNVFQRMNGD